MAKGEFRIMGVESGSFKDVIHKSVSVTYTGQAVTYNTLKAAASNRYNIVFTGTQVSGSGIWQADMLHEIDPAKEVFDESVDYIVFDKRVLIVLD